MSMPSSGIVSFFALFTRLFLTKGSISDQYGFSCTSQTTERFNCSVKSDKLRLFIVADTGGGKDGPTEGQQKVAEEMGTLANELNMVLNLGDNFYEEEVTRQNAKERFEMIFVEVFGKIGSEEMPWYTIAGNKDYNHSVQYKAILPQIKLTDGKWTFPAPYYTIHYNFGNIKSVSVHFVMIDTVILCGASRKDFKQFNTEAKEKASNDHFEWLKNELEMANNVDFLFVAGHYPLYVVENPERSFSCAKRFNEMLRIYRVTAYFSGHEHNLKHVVTKEGVQMFVSGAGSRMESANKEKHVPEEYKDLLKFWYPDFVDKEKEYTGGGFIEMEIEEKSKKAKINFYAAGHIHQTEQTLSKNKFNYTIELESRENL